MEGEPIIDRRKEEMSQQGANLVVNTRPARDFPRIPTLLLQSILVDSKDPDAIEKANRSLELYVKTHSTRVGKKEFLVSAWRFFAIHFQRSPYYRDVHAFARLKDVATALGASVEFSQAWDYAEGEQKEPI